MKKTVAVALSGGLDSSVAALLLKKNKCHVIGLHLDTGFEGDFQEGPYERPHDPAARARRLAEQIGIEFQSIDCADIFKREVVDYFIGAYAGGKTPSPCVVCNRRIKFHILLKEARALGATALATGHYARVLKTAGGRTLLMKGIDPGKDQSYFLCRLTQADLRYALFPLGEYTKAHVQALAEASGLVCCSSRESQELCFVTADSYKEFLARYGKLSPNPGPIVNLDNQVVGQHQGLHGYTIGQRRGIGIPGPEPYYVVAFDMDKNALIVGPKLALQSRGCIVEQINWIGIDPPTGPIWVKTRLRYRHSEAGSVLFPVDGETARVVFVRAQEAATPGQAAVFYQGEKVLGGGWIA